ncbi:hypothetical protein AC249_AIPGENE10840 [Exaiptasia diaphana]|nr:hypothetical protein AC249_AIPGENE10840 [Exaiptasia diaphana]
MRLTQSIGEFETGLLPTLEKSHVPSRSVADFRTYQENNAEQRLSQVATQIALLAQYLSSLKIVFEEGKFSLLSKEHLKMDWRRIIS